MPSRAPDTRITTCGWGSSPYLVTGDVETARDLAHEALTRAAAAGLDFRSPGAPAYLRTTVLNLWRRRLRRLASEGRALLRLAPPASFPSPDDAVADRDAVWRALAGVPYHSRVCLVLRYYEDLPVAEIAAELGKPVGTVKSLLARGLKRMATLLGERDAGS